MDLFMTSSINLGNNNEMTENALDLSQNTTISTESVGHEMPEFRNGQQATTERPSAADLQLKRRREFDIKFNNEVKKLKLDEPKMPAVLEISQADTPPNIALIVRHARLLQRMIKVPVSTNLKSMVPYRICPLRVRKSYRVILFPALKKEPACYENLDAPDTLTTGNSLIQPPSSSSVQSVSATAHTSSASEGVNIKQELSDRENISSIVSNIDHQNVSPANEESPDVEIGPYGTRVSKKYLAKINGMGVSIATRALLTLVFDRQTLATHTLSGKPSNRFLKSNRTIKPQLDQFKVADIIHYVKRVFKCTESDIRETITMKCAEIDRVVKKKSLSKANID